jgi:hypothetical protein
MNQALYAHMNNKRKRKKKELGFKRGFCCFQFCKTVLLAVDVICSFDVSRLTPLFMFSVDHL